MKTHKNFILKKYFGKKNKFLDKVQRSEKGQAMVEFALVLPIFISLLCFVLDCGWLGYQTVLFDYGYRAASWQLEIKDREDMDPYRIYESESNALIKKNVLKAASFLKEKNLVVHGSRITVSSRYKDEKQPGKTPGKFERTQHHIRDMEMDAILTYDLHPLTPIGKTVFGENIRTRKMVHKKRVLTIQSQLNATEQ